MRALLCWRTYMLGVIYAECHNKPFVLSVILLNVISLSVIMLSVVSLSVIILSAVEPKIIHSFKVSWNRVSLKLCCTKLCPKREQTWESILIHRIVLTFLSFSLERDTHFHYIDLVDVHQKIFLNVALKPSSSWEQTSGAVFTTLHFLRNLRIGTIS